MKGMSEMAITMLLMIMITVLLAGMLWLWFQGGVTAQPPLPAEQRPACSSHADCYPGLCMTMGGGAVFCGCLDDSHCGGKTCGTDNRCR